jgi:hypothetical protein
LLPVLRADGLVPTPAPDLSTVFLGVLTGADASKRPGRRPTSAAGSREVTEW